MKQIVMGVSLAVLASAGVAIAAQAQAGPDPMGDKAVTRAEVQAKAEERFAAMDVNKDGKLDAADRGARLVQKFAEMDTNKDGALSQAEFVAAHQQRGDDRRGDGPGKDGRMGHHGRDGHGGPDGRGKLIDGDANGTVTRAEFVAAHMKMFEAADANKDGTVTAAERKALRGKWGDRPGRAMPPPPPGT